MSTPPVRVCVSPGPFRAAAVFATAVVRGAAGEIEIRRSRNPTDWDWATHVIGVGGRCEVDAAGRRWYDCRRVGLGSRDTGAPYADFGLVWRDLGADLLAAHLPAAAPPIGVLWAWRRIDRDLVTPVDAADHNPTAAGVGVGADLDRAVQAFNPPWDAAHRTAVDYLAGFRAAVRWAGEALGRAADHGLSAWRAYEIVRAAYATRDDPRLLVLPATLPWQRPLLDDLGDAEVLFVLYPHDDVGWVVQAVPNAYGAARALRRPFPAAWRGLTDKSLQAQTGVRDAVFCRAEGSMVGARTREGARLAADLALADVTTTCA